MVCFGKGGNNVLGVIILVINLFKNVVEVFGIVGLYGGLCFSVEFYLGNVC